MDQSDSHLAFSARVLAGPFICVRMLNNEIAWTLWASACYHTQSQFDA